MKNRIAINAFIAIVILLGGCAPVPKLSSMQIRQITTRMFEGSYEDIYRSCLTVLQDQGYIIKSTDMNSGLIVANVDRAVSGGSQFAQSMLLGYVADKGTEVEVSCMVNRINDQRSEVRINIQETQYGQASVWSGTSKQNTKTIYNKEVYNNLLNQILVEVKRREAINSSP